MISYDELCFLLALTYQLSYSKINILLTKFWYAVEKIILERPFIPVSLKHILKSQKKMLEQFTKFFFKMITK